MTHINNMKKAGKVSMIANMTKVNSVPAQAADALLYDLGPTPTPSGTGEIAVAPVVPLVTAPVKQAPVVKVPFTNQLTPETFLRLKQFECWGGMEIQDILEEALTAFFADKPEADRELPAKAREKLKKKLPNLR